VLHVQGAHSCWRLVTDARMQGQEGVPRLQDCVGTLDSISLCYKYDVLHEAAAHIGPAHRLADFPWHSTQPGEEAW